MKFEPIPSSRIPYEWGWLSRLLEPAIKVAKNVDPMEVFRDLVSGNSFAWYIGERNGAVVAVVAPYEGDILMIEYLAGQIDGGPKLFMKTVRAGVAEIEEAAKRAGSKEIRFTGRNWGMILTDFELIQGKNDEWRKVL